jgi:aspartyl-tRNA(Asn)/glutamyl-tRNA(Gln) amidotransferase subunit A
MDRLISDCPTLLWNKSDILQFTWAITRPNFTKISTSGADLFFAVDKVQPVEGLALIMKVKGQFSNPTHASVREILSAFERREMSPVAIVENVVTRVQELNAKVNAFSLFDGDSAVEAARISETAWAKGVPRGPLEGIPVTIKDVSIVSGWGTTSGSLTRDGGRLGTEDSPPVARLREAGAILLGMTTTPEFGWKAVTDNRVQGITRNPWDTTKTSGGSSGGAVVAASLGFGYLHLGSDGGGSIRIPASFSGVVGHKPSFGRVPTAPPSSYGTVSHVGPIAQRVEDAALMLNVLSQPDNRDWYALPSSSTDYTETVGNCLEGIRVAFSPTLGYCKVDTEVAASVRSAVELLSAAGAIVDEVDPGFADPLDIFHVHWFSAAGKILRGIPKVQWKNLDPGFLEIAQHGQNISLSEYQDAVSNRVQLGVLMRLFHRTYDVLITPTVPITAFAAGEEVANPSQKRWTEWATFSYPFNLTQQPACSIPCGVSSAGLPIGIQIVGRMHDDQTVLKVAGMIESLLGGPLLPPAFPNISTVDYPHIIDPDKEAVGAHSSR